MAHYFTREEAEALLPAITIVLETIQGCGMKLRELEQDLAELHAQAANNGHHLHARIATLQKSLVQQTNVLRTALHELQTFGCELKDPDTGLIDFLSLRDGQEIYLCWRLGEERIAFWHDLDTGFAGRQPL